MDYVKRKEESLVSYWIRLYKNRSIYGLTFAECGELMNEVSGENWSEARWRRTIQNYLEIQDYLDQENPTGVNQDVLQEIEDQKLELEKEKIRMRDKKREMSAELRRLARLEQLEDYLRETVEQFEPIELENIKKTKVDNGKELLVGLSDFHIGMSINSKFNTFNKEIAIKRLSKLQQKTMEKVLKENIQTIHIANLGDLIHGLIHVSARVSAEENTIEQVITASEMVKEFIKPFLDLGIQVEYYNICGNHSRIVANKSESGGEEESFEKLILTIVDTAFSRYSNYNSTGSEFGMIEVNIKNEKVVLAHGHLDKGNGIVNKLPQMLGYPPTLVLTGHFHSELIKDYGVTTHIISGALCGSDDYATNLRLAGKPSQKILVITDDGIEENNTIYL